MRKEQKVYFKHSDQLVTQLPITMYWLRQKGGLISFPTYNLIRKCVQANMISSLSHLANNILFFNTFSKATQGLIL